MSTIPTVEFTQALASLLFATILFFIAFISAYKAGYFKWPAFHPNPKIGLTECFQLFLLFMTLQFIVFPLLLYWGFVQDIEKVKLDFELTGWLNLGAIYGMTFLLAIFFYFKRNQVHSLFASASPLYDIGIGILSWLIAFPSALLISQVMVLILTHYLGYTLEDQSAVIHMKKSLEDPNLFMATLFAVVLVVPILEEMLFRGFLQSSIRNYLSPFSSILISSILFSWFHFSFNQGMNNFNILTSLFVLALFLGFLRERQGNLLPSIALHATFNAISVAMIVLSS